MNAILRILGFYGLWAHQEGRVVGYTRTIFSDGWDQSGNSIDVIFGMRNRKQTIGSKLSGIVFSANDMSFN